MRWKKIVIAAVLVLVVLIVLFLIFTGRINLVQEGLRNCDGECKVDEFCGSGKVAVPTDNCNDQGEDYRFCCLTVVE